MASKSFLISLNIQLHNNPSRSDSFSPQSCLRCNRAHRSCPGYTSSKDLKFVNYSGAVNHDVPAQLPSPPSDKIPKDISAETEFLNWEHIEQQALREFFDDYWVYSPDQNLSRGYLSGLPAMLKKAGPKSDVANACTTIGLASLGKKTRDQRVLQRAQSLHTSLLRSFSLSITKGDTFISIESLIIATLLGLHEVSFSCLTIASHELNCTDHHQH